MTLNLQEKLDEMALKSYINAFVDGLCKRENAIVFASDQEFPNKAGVYSVFEQCELIYIGESGNLKKRLRDLRNTKNHSLRRKLGEKLYSQLKSYFPASSKESFPDTIEDKLTNYMEQNLFILALPTNACRKEIEEQAVKKYKKKLLNTRGKRE